MSRLPSVDFIERDTIEEPVSLIDLPTQARQTAQRTAAPDEPRFDLRSPVQPFGPGGTPMFVPQFARNFIGGAYDTSRSLAASLAQGTSDALHGISRGLVDLEGTTDIPTDRGEQLVAEGRVSEGRRLLDQAEMVNAVGRAGFAEGMRRERGRVTPGTDPDSWSYFGGSVAGGIAPSVAGLATGPIGVTAAMGAYASQAFEDTYDRVADAQIESGGRFDPNTAKAVGTVAAGVQAILELIPIRGVEAASKRAIARLADAAASGSASWRNVAAREIATLVGTGSVQEGATEAAQELADEIIALTYDDALMARWQDDPQGAATDVAKRVGTAALGGALGGGLLGGAGAVGMAGRVSLVEAESKQDRSGIEEPSKNRRRTVEEPSNSVQPDVNSEATRSELGAKSESEPVTQNRAVEKAIAEGKTAPIAAKPTPPGTTTGESLYRAAFQQSYAEVVDLKDGANVPRKVTPKDAVRALRKARLWPKERDPSDFAIAVVQRPGFEPIAKAIIETPKLSRGAMAAMFGSKVAREQFASQEDRNAWQRTFVETAKLRWPDLNVEMGAKAGSALRGNVYVPPPKSPKGKATEEEPMPHDYGIALDDDRLIRSRRYWQDDIVQLELLERKLADAGATIKPSESPTTVIRLAASRMHAAKERLKSKYDGILTRMRESRVPMRDLMRFMFAQHAGEANDVIARITADPNLGYGMTNAAAVSVLDDAERAGRAKEYAAIADEWRDLLNDDPDAGIVAMQEAGVIDDEEFAKVSRYENYVPTVDDPAFVDEAPTAISQYRRFGIGRNQLQRRTGRTQGSLDKPSERMNAMLDAGVAHIVEALNRRVDRIMQNRVANAVLRLADRHRSAAALEIVHPESVPKIAMIDKDGQRKVVPDPQFIKSDDILPMRVEMPGEYWGREYRRGERAYVRIGDPELGKVLRTSTRDDDLGTKIVGRTLGFGKNVLRSVNTSLNPFFWIRSAFFREATDAFATMDLTGLSKEEARQVRRMFVRNFFPAFRAVFSGEVTGNESGRLADRWKEMKDVGGVQRMFERTSFELSSKYVRRVAEGGVGKTIEDAKGLIKFIEHLGTPFENAARLALYDALVSVGMEPEYAAVRARDVSIDFQKKGAGELARWARLSYPFFNARVQGVERTARFYAGGTSVGRKIARGGVQAASGAAGLMFLIGFLEGMQRAFVGGEDKDEDGMADWKQTPDFEQRQAITIYTGTSKPLTIEVGWILNVPRIIGKATARAAFGDITYDRALADAIGGVLNVANPMGGEDVLKAVNRPYAFARHFVPATFQWMTDLMMNQDWQGRRIYDDFGAGDPGHRRSDEGRDSTPWPAKGTSRLLREATGIDSYPEVWSYPLSIFAGGLWRGIERTGRTIAAAVNESQRADFDVDDVPVVRDWLSQTPNASVTADDYYRIREEAAQWNAEFERIIENDGAKAAGSFIDANPRMAATHEAIFGRNGTESWLRKLRAERRDMRLNGASEEEMREVTQEIARNQAMALRAYRTFGDDKD